MLAASKKVNKVLQQYNNLPKFGDGPHNLQREDAVNLDSPMWGQNLASLPSSTGTIDVSKTQQRKLMDSVKLQKRAAEETKFLLGDIERLNLRIMRLKGRINTTYTNISESEERTPYDMGTLALLGKYLTNLESWHEHVNRITHSGYLETNAAPASISSEVLNEILGEIEDLENSESSDIDSDIEDIH